ncbi:MAG: hypothetical protein CR997_05225 [Acidobacteria bacterium]|nr:MAG: hypothetical protein CR997_05225 [Acidobacteriota bacterium]
MNDVVSCFPDNLKPFLAILVFMEAFILMTNGLMNTAIDYFNHSRHPGFSMAFFQTATKLPGVTRNQWFFQQACSIETI